MPTDLVVRGGEVAGGFWIQRVPEAATVRRPQRLVRVEDNKENVLPFDFAGPMPWRRRQRTRKSPLPEWHRRTPLRDITAIINAIERRRLRVQAAAACAQQLSNRDNEASHEDAHTVTSQTPIPDSSLIPDSDSTPIHTITTTCITPSSSSPIVHPLPTPSTCGSFSETEEKLCRTIEQIEEMVKKQRKTKKTVKDAASAKRVMQRKTLMSMR